MHRGVAWTAMVVWFGATTGATAEELVATRPGVMCASADTLARLTLPNGDSRTHAATPRPDDLAAAAAGGCIDIPPGARVTVQQAFRNTSRVTYTGPGAPADGVVTIPNIDFQRAGDAPAAPAELVPPGYAVAQRVPVGDGTTLILLLDRRLTPALQTALWGHGDLFDEALYGQPALIAEFTKRPPVNARLALLSAGEEVVAQRALERPMAKIEPLRVGSLPAQTIVLAVDWATGNPFFGPFGELLTPHARGLAPVMAAPVRGGTDEQIMLNNTNHADWRVGPSRRGGPEEIEAWNCPMDPPRLDLRTYRFAGDHWIVAHRAPTGDCRLIEAFPDRSAFP